MVLIQTLPFNPLELPFLQQHLFGNYLIYSVKLNPDDLIKISLSGCSKQPCVQLLTSFYIPHRPPIDDLMIQHLLITFSVI